MEVTTKIVQSILPLVILLNLGKENIKLGRNIHPYNSMLIIKIVCEVELDITVLLVNPTTSWKTGLESGLICYQCVGTHPGCTLYNMDTRWYWGKICPRKDDRCVKVKYFVRSQNIWLKNVSCKNILHHELYFPVVDRKKRS